MNLNELIPLWQAEENMAHIHGWDFSHLSGRYTEENDLPWNYRTIILKHLRPEMKLLDLDTGGGEFLLSLNHPASNTSATESFPPNVELCKKVLLPLGIDFRTASARNALPFGDAQFDLVINRHGEFNEHEIHRILKPGGLFITQQVGAENDRELVNLLLPEKNDLPFPEQYLSTVSARFKSAGFDILTEDECFRPIKFYDVGALVWFARIIEWEFPGFSVNHCMPELIKAQQLLESNGCIEGRIHRFLLIAQRK